MGFDIKSNKENHTITWLKSKDDAGKLNKSISIQRKEVWDAEKKSNLIISILSDIPIESLLFEEDGADGYNVLDGKQRTLTITAYLDDRFGLCDKIRVKSIDDFELTGKRFSELSEELQKKIKEYELSIATLRPLDAEARSLVFFMRNQAVPLSKMDLSRVLLGEEAMNTISELCKSPFFMQKVKLTEPARRKNEDLKLVLQYMILSSNVQNGLSGRAIMSLCDDIKNSEYTIDELAITRVLEYLDKAISEKKQYLKKVQIPIVMLIADAALESGMEPSVFGEKLNAFFESLDPNGEFMLSCKSGSAKKQNVQLRINTMKSAILG